MDILRIENVSMCFGGLTAVNSVSAAVPQGCIFGLIGPNGAGKTTLFNVISGVYKPTQGQIYFQDQQIQSLPPHKINALGIARTYQNINLFKKMTVLENVLVSCHTKTASGFWPSLLHLPAQRKEENNAKQKCLNILEFMELSEKAYQPANSLSYGEQRRLEISRALASEPAMLLLDEPAAGMNATEKDSLTNTIRRIAQKGITVLLVEHDMNLVMKVTHIVCVINFGKKIAFGTPEEIQKDPQVIQAYLGGGLDV